MYDDILQNFPPPSQNNARAIVREKLVRMHESPNDRTAKELDTLGLSVDFDDYFGHIDEIERHE